MEAIVSLGIACTIISICCSIYMQSEKNIELIGNQINSMSNLRIAMDFVGDKLREGQSILIESGGVKANGSKIYLKNNILRYNTDSEQIACDISSFMVEKENDLGLYKITLVSGINSMNSLITLRK